MKESLMQTYARKPIAFQRGENCWLITEDGTRYLDALSGIAVCNIGHANPDVAQAIGEQARELVHTSNLYQIPMQNRLAEELCRLSGLDRVFFSNSGAEANEAAIKICRKYAHGKGVDNPCIVVMHGGFHGRTMATLSATGNPGVQDGFAPLLEGFRHIPYNDLEALSRLESEIPDIVAIMLEPIQGEGGVVVPDPGYLAAIRTLCSKNGWLMVLDEVQTGMCRTGRFFAGQLENVRPDIMTLSKSLGNGFPIGACLVNADTAEVMTPGSHGSTFGGNPLACRASLTVIDYMENNHLAERAAQLGAGLKDVFQDRLAGMDGVVDIRGRGLMLGIELDRDCGELVNMALERKMLINVTAGNVIRLLPPLTTSENELEIIADGITGLLTNYLGG